MVGKVRGDRTNHRNRERLLRGGREKVSWYNNWNVGGGWGVTRVTTKMEKKLVNGFRGNSFTGRIP